MPYIDPKRPYDHMTKLEDWVELIRKTVHWKFPHIKGDDYDDLLGNIYLKLAHYDFPHCVKGFDSQKCGPRAPYNYCFTTVLRCHYDYTMKMKKYYTYQIDNLEDVGHHYYFDDYDFTELSFNNLSGVEKQIYLDIMDSKNKNIHKLYEPWQLEAFSYAIGISSTIVN